MKTKFLSALLGLAAVVALAGCVTPLSTPSGRPEVIIASSTEAIKSALVGSWAPAGWSIDQDTTYSLRFVRAATGGEDVAAALLVGNGYSTNSRAVTFTLAPTPEGKVRVMASNAWLAQMPGGQTRAQDATGGRAGQELQSRLEQLKQALERPAQTVRDVPMHNSFDPASLEPFKSNGSSQIAGQAFLTTKEGDVKIGAGREIRLFPVTPYFKEVLDDIGHGFRPADYMKIRDQFLAVARKTVSDAQGNFEFHDLPAGEYSLEVEISWGMSTATIHKFVMAEEGKSVRVMLTR